MHDLRYHAQLDGQVTVTNKALESRLGPSWSAHLNEVASARNTDGGKRMTTVSAEMTKRQCSLRGLVGRIQLYWEQDKRQLS